jgi:transcriptional regulator with XRE-family HTH domain
VARVQARDGRKSRAQPLDAQIGLQVRARRVLAGLTQSDLAIALGLTFQQVQKYENGTNRISASRLKQIADRLGVPISSFFEEADAEIKGEAPWWGRTDALDLLRFYYAIPAPARRQLLQLAKALADAQDTDNQA